MTQSSSTLVLRVAGPLLSFGVDSLYRTRKTIQTPSRSALQGLLAAASGVKRGQQYPSWISEANMVVREEVKPKVIRDFHTVNPLIDAKAEPYTDLYYFLEQTDRERLHVMKRANAPAVLAKSSHIVQEPRITNRFYLAGSSFLVCVEDPTGNIEDAVKNPVWHLYAGRKSCSLTAPFFLGSFNIPVQDAAVSAPSLRSHTDDESSQILTRSLTSFTPLEGIEPLRKRSYNDQAVDGVTHVSQVRYSYFVKVPASTAKNWFEWGENLQVFFKEREQL